MTIRLARALLVLALLACSRGDAGDGAGASDLKRPPSRLVKPDPMAVRATVDTSMEVDEYIVAKVGGQVVTIDQQRGLMYTLTIPPNGLFANERIAMAPVKSIEGLPLSGGLTGAVRLEPDGLQLAAPATLRIVKFDAASLGGGGTPEGPHVGFATEGDGAELRLQVASTSDSGIVIHLSHFSIEGGARGTAADIAAQAARAPTSPGAQYEQRVAAAIEKSSAKTGSDGAAVSKAADPEAYAELEELFAAEYHDVVRPAIVAAGSDPDAIAAAATLFHSWLARFQLRGGEENGLAKESRDGRKLLQDAIGRAYDRAVDRCRKGVDLGAVSMLLAIERASQLMGFTEGEMFPKLGEELDACTAVEVAFESKIDFHWADGVTNSHDVVRAAVPLEFDLARGSFKGTGPLEYVSATGVLDGRMGSFVGGCLMRVLGPSKPGRFEVLGLFLARNPKTDARAALGDSISLLIDPGTPQHRYRGESCKGLATLAPQEVMEGDGWRPGWEDQHREQQMEWIDGAARSLANSETQEPRLAWLIDKWEPGSGAVLARRTFDDTMSNQFGRVVEHTTIELRRRARN